LREKTGLSVVSRADIWRVTVREPAGTRRWGRMVAGATIGAAITAVPGYVAFAMYENGNHAGPLQFILLGTGVGAAVGAMRAPEQVFRERIVYVRP
jgi:hypothetical protein